jgi:hypothetical protein
MHYFAVYALEPLSLPLSLYSTRYKHVREARENALPGRILTRTLLLLSLSLYTTRYKYVRATPAKAPNTPAWYIKSLPPPDSLLIHNSFENSLWNKSTIMEFLLLLLFLFVPLACSCPPPFNDFRYVDNETLLH